MHHNPDRARPLEHLSEADLVERVRQGCRDAGAEFLYRNRDKLRRRIRQRLRLACRRLFDSEEILSTVNRRLDRLVRNGHVRARSPAELMGLAFKIVHHSVVDKAEITAMADRTERGILDARAEPGGDDTQGGARTEGERADMIQRLLAQLPTQRQRDILWLWLRDCSLVQMAQEFGTSPSTLRKQWQRIRTQCEAILLEGHADS